MSEFTDCRSGYSSQASGGGCGGFETQSLNCSQRQQSIANSDFCYRPSDNQSYLDASRNQNWQYQCFEQPPKSQQYNRSSASDEMIKTGLLPKLEMTAYADQNSFGRPAQLERFNYSKPVPPVRTVPIEKNNCLPSAAPARTVPLEQFNCFTPVSPARPGPIEGKNCAIESNNPAAKNKAHTEKTDCAKELKLLSSKTSTTDQKLRAIQSLVAAGKTSVELEVSPGKKVHVRLEVEQTGNRQMVHMFVPDEKNHEKTVLRGITKKDGSFERERDRKGNFVDYYGVGAKLVYNSTKQSENCVASNAKPSRVLDGGNGAGGSDFRVKQADRQTLRNSVRNGPVSEGKQFSSYATGYYPFNNAMEGGFKDKLGKPLCTLQQYLRGEAPYVSVAMDDRAGFRYGQEVQIKELEQKYGRPIKFKIVDTGGAFRGKGTGRIDICTENANETYKVTGNVTLTFPPASDARPNTARIASSVRRGYRQA